MHPQVGIECLSKPIPDTFHKSPRITAIFTKKDLEFFPGYNNIWPFFLSMSAFVLCPASANVIPKKRGHKRSAIFSVGSIYIEMVFALLAKPIAIQMWFSVIQVGKASLEGLFFWLYWRCRDLDLGLDLGLILDSVHVGLHEKLEKLFGGCRWSRCRGGLRTISGCWGHTGQWVWQAVLNASGTGPRITFNEGSRGLNLIASNGNSTLGLSYTSHCENRMYWRGEM